MRCSMQEGKEVSEMSRRLLVESDDGSPASEYRIVGEKVKVRTLTLEDGFANRAESLWRQLTPEQLRTHVERNTVVARWLERRLGWRQLLRACVGEALFTRPTEGSLDRSPSH
jgi:hypothetical protein